MTVNTIIETDRVCDVAILQEAWRGRCAEPERYHSVVCQVFRDGQGQPVQIAAFEDAQTHPVKGCYPLAVGLAYSRNNSETQATAAAGPGRTCPQCLETVRAGADLGNTSRASV